MHASARLRFHYYAATAPYNSRRRKGSVSTVGDAVDWVAEGKGEPCSWQLYESDSSCAEH